MAISGVRAPFWDKGGAEFHASAYGMVANGSTDDTDAWEAVIAAAGRALVSIPTIIPDGNVGAIVRLPHGRPTLTRALVVPEGVTIIGAGNFSTQIFVDLGAAGATADAFTWPAPPLRSINFCYGGGLRDLDIFADTGDARDIVHLESPMQWIASGVRLYGGGRYGLYANECIDTSVDNIKLASNGVTGLFIEGSGPSTTFRARGVYVNNPGTGPAMDVEGIGLVFDGCIFENAVHATGGTGFRLRWGVATLTGCYFENNLLHDIEAGAEDNAQKTSIAVVNPVLVKHVSKVVASVKLDHVDYATLIGGDYSAMPIPVEMTANAGHVSILTDLAPNAPTLTSGAHWRTKPGLHYAPGDPAAPQGAVKAAIAVAGTAAFTVPTFGAAFLRVYAMVSYDPSSGLQTGVEIRISKENGVADGGAVVTLLGNDSAGNFQVVAGDFVTTFPTADSVLVTYTNNNPVGANTIQFKVEGIGIGGDVSIA